MKLNESLAAAALFTVVASFPLRSAGASSDPMENWPQWRGPLQTGVAPKATPPTTWSETNNIKWKVKLPGAGWATPIVFGDRIFIETAIPTGKKVDPQQAAETSATPGAPTPTGAGPGRGPGRRGGGDKPTEVQQFVTMCLDRSSGKTLWQQVSCETVPHEPYRQNEGTFASSSGLTDGEHYFAWFGSRGLYCYDMEGKLKWSQDLGDLRIVMGFGEGNSIGLSKDTLVVNFDHEDGSFITALDKKTGKTLWKQAREEPTSWSTPLVLEHEGKPQAIINATGKIRSYDLASGKVLWECGGMTKNVIPSPVAEDGVVYCMSGFQGNALLAIRLGGSGDITDTDHVLWRHKKSTPYVPSPLLMSGKLYFLANNNPIVSCLDTKTGKPFYDAERLEEIRGVYASPIGANGKVYIAGRNGVTVVLKDSEKLEVLATNVLEEKLEATPVTVGKELFLRGREYLYCISEEKAPSP
jgi:outer membrane protein assembly factor BamB